MAHADLPVVRVVPGGDLERPCSELDVHVLVRNDGHFAPYERHHRVLAHELAVAGILGIDRHRGVAQDGLRAGGGDGQCLRRPHDGVSDVVELRGSILVLHLKVRDGRPAPHAPVDQVHVAVEVTLLVEGDEDLGDGLLVILVHGEALTLVVAGTSEALELVDDGGAVLLAPLPDPLLESLAADVLFAEPLLGELALHLVLGGDTGVVGPHDPKAFSPLSR